MENPLAIFLILLEIPYPQPSLFFLWNSPFHLLKTEGVNQKTPEDTSEKNHPEIPGIFQNLDFNIT